MSEIKRAAIVALAAAAAIAGIVIVGGRHKAKDIAPPASTKQTVLTAPEATEAQASATVTGGEGDRGVSLTGIDIGDEAYYIVNIKNGGSSYINYGNEYTLERLEGGSFAPLPRSEGYEFSQGGNVIAADYETDQLYDKAAYQGSLEPGVYRFTAAVYTALDVSEQAAAHPSIIFEISSEEQKS